MRRIGTIALLVLPIVAVAVGWRIWTRPPALLVSSYPGDEARKND
jgi:hypothetical protein